MKLMSRSISLLALLLSTVCMALDEDGAAVTVPYSVEQQIQEKVQRAFPAAVIRQISPVVVGQIYQVLLDDNQRLHVFNEGGYFLSGSLYQFNEQGFDNLTELHLQRQRQQLLAGLAPSDYLTLPASGEAPKAVVYLFVDIDCYYCRIQLEEAAILQQAGVELRFLSDNRQRPGSSAYNKVKRTWCSTQPQLALELLMAGRSIKADACDNAMMERHKDLAQALGVDRLPAIITADGALYSGLLRASQLLSILALEMPVTEQEDSMEVDAESADTVPVAAQTEAL